MMMLEKIFVIWLDELRLLIRNRRRMACLSALPVLFALTFGVIGRVAGFISTSLGLVLMSLVSITLLAIYPSICRRLVSANSGIAISGRVASCLSVLVVQFVLYMGMVALLGVECISLPTVFLVLVLSVLGSMALARLLDVENTGCA